MKFPLKYKINLDNFENPEFDNANYVLTSPRSLEATKMAGVEPVNLIYKSFRQFKEEMVPDGIPIEEVHSVYEAHEEHRKKLIELCRNLRNRQIQTNFSDQNFLRSSSVPTRYHETPYFPQARSSSSSKRNHFYRNELNEIENPDSDSKELHRRLNDLENEIKNCEKLLSSYFKKEKKVSFLDNCEIIQTNNIVEPKSSTKFSKNQKDPYIELLKKKSNKIHFAEKERQRVINYRQKIAHDMFMREEMAYRKAKMLNHERSNSATRNRQLKENRIRENRLKLADEKIRQKQNLERNFAKKEETRKLRSEQKEKSVNLTRKRLIEMEVERARKRHGARSFNKMNTEAKIASSALRTHPRSSLRNY